MNTETINAKLVRILTENPELPIKVVIDIDTDLGGTLDGWVGELCDCKVTEFANYESHKEYWFGYMNDTLRGYLCEDIWDKRWDEVYKSLSEKDKRERCRKADSLTESSFSDDELERLADQEIAAMDWKPCILLSVGPNRKE